MDWKRFIRPGGVRRFENFWTGYNLTPLGHGITLGVSAGMIGYAVINNKYFGPKILNEVPGIQQAEAMSYDFRSNPGLGASGDLTLALSKFGLENNL